MALVTSRPVEEDARRQAANLRFTVYAGDRQEKGSSLSDLMSMGEAARPLPDVSPEDLLALLYTSGTTGTPKGTMHSHRSLIAPVAASIKLRELWTLRPDLNRLGKMAKALARYGERLLRAVGRPQTFLSTVSWHTITGLEGMLRHF